ncbi:pectate lyase family protein [Streptomyces sp. 4N509B]|uniref:pectate lyase family protein n=1 Tax=Streptomyces sp. 4N509B TaxID=3457413 RepID=UPI003FD57AB3
MRHHRPTPSAHPARLRTTTRTTLLAALAGCAALTVTLVPGTAQAGDATTATAAGTGRPAPDPARAVLPAGDGWGSAGEGVTGGSAADAEHVYTVANRAELAAALTAGDADTPRIIRIEGTIDANTDDQGNPLTCDDYATDGYTLDGYLTAYDPATWGKVMPSGPMEDARLASAANQAERVVLPVGSHTTIIGAGDDARLLGGTLDVRGAHNVIIRNVTFEDAYDCFPQWDGRNEGEWNSEYDNVVLDGATNVWLDHNTFTDGRRPDSEQPRYFGALYQQHDGLLDIVRGADLVTVSWNVFTDHSKSILIGNSDGASGTDRGRLRTTFHHNLFENVGERAPRVRFGQVDVYNNHFRQDADSPYYYVYSWGIGAESALVAEHNAFTLPGGTDPASVIHRWTAGTSVTESGNLVNRRPVDLLDAYNAANPEAQVGDDAGWTPTLRTRVDHPRALPSLLDTHAGAGELRHTR